MRATRCLILAFLLVAALAATGRAQEPPSPPETPAITPAPTPTPTPAPAPPAPVPGEVAASEPPPSPARREFVFVPYDRAEGPRLTPDRSVLLSYAEFLRLKETARVDEPEFEPIAALSQATYEGEVTGDVARLTAEFVIDVLARDEDRAVVHLPFRGAAIERATVAGERAYLAPLPEEGGLAVHLTGGGRRTVTLHLAVALGSDAAVRLFEFNAPRAAAASLALTVPGAVVLESRPGGLPAVVVRSDATATRIEASCGSSARIVVAWKPSSVAPEVGAPAEAILSVSEAATIQVKPRSLGGRSDLAIEVFSGATERLEVELPTGVKLLRAHGAFVKGWTAPDARGKATVDFVRAMDEPFSVTLEYEAAYTDEAAQVTIPRIDVAGVVRHTGTLHVVPDAALSLWPEESRGLEVIPPAGSTPGARAFSFAQAGWSLAITARPVTARVRAAGMVLYEVTDDVVRLNGRLSLTIDERQLFEVAIEVPEGFELREAGPSDLVAGFRQRDRRVEVTFRGGQRGTATLTLALQRPRPATEGEVVLTALVVEGADDTSGHVVLAAPLALKATELEATGVQAVDARGLGGALGDLVGADLTPMLGYRFFGTGFRVRVGIERQRTRMTCEASLLASIAPALMRIDGRLDYVVEFSAADEFRLLLPASAGEDVRFIGDDIKEKTRATPSPSDELTTWTVRLQRRVIGPYSLHVSFDVPLAGAESGKPQSVTVPEIHATGVARETGFVAVQRSENIEVRVRESAGLEMRDVKELPASLGGAFLGFRYFEPSYALSLELMRHELESVLGAIVRRLHIETGLSDQREATHEVFLEVQNSREQYLELRLPEGVDIWEAFVRGAPVRTTTRQSDGARLVELSKSETMSEAFRVRLILKETLAGGALGLTGRLQFHPPVPLNMPVLRATWKLYLPDRFHYMDFGGTMRFEPGRRPAWAEEMIELALATAPAQLAGGVARPAIQPGRVVAPTGYDHTLTAAERAAASGGFALEIPIQREGKTFVFSKQSGVGEITIRFWRSKALLVLQLVLFFLVAGGLAWAALRTRSATLAPVVFLVAFAVASLTDGFWGRVFATLYAAALVALVVHFVAIVARQFRTLQQQRGDAAQALGEDEEAGEPEAAKAGIDAAESDEEEQKSEFEKREDSTQEEDSGADDESSAAEQPAAPSDDDDDAKPGDAATGEDQGETRRKRRRHGRGPGQQS